MSSSADLAVVGGGPAGTAAAISATQAGLAVTLIERCPFPRHRPGETLHPGAEAIFRQLGVSDCVLAASAIRPRAIAASWSRMHTVRPFGGNGAWRGYSKIRRNLYAILLS